MTQPANKRVVTEAAQATAIGVETSRATAAEATKVPKWQPSTTYTAGDVVMTPDGSIVKRLTSGTSGSSYSSTNWQTVATVSGTQANTELNNMYAGVSQVAYDVHRSGVIGDGTTDDTTNLNAAFTAAGAGATVRLRSGLTYLISGQLTPLAKQKIDARGATVKLAASGSALTYNVFQPASGVLLDISGLTLDGNKVNTVAPADTTVAGMFAFITDTAGWSGQHRLRDIKISNLHALGIRIRGNSSMSSSASDGYDAAESAAIIENIYIDTADIGIMVDRCRGVTLINPYITNTTREGIYDTLSRSTQVLGGRVANCGRHGVLTQYTYGHTSVGVTSRGNAKTGFCAGGGTDANGITRRFRWDGCIADGNTESGFQVDPTLITHSNGQTWPVMANITGCEATGNTIHGFYLHRCAELTLVGAVATDNAASGLALDSYRIAVSGGVFTRNLYGINFQGVEVAAGGQTGYGWHKIAAVQVYGNTSEDFLMGSGTVGWQGTVLALSGSGSPEGVVRGTVGSSYTDTDTGDLYRKTSFTTGTGSNGKTGWAAPNVPLTNQYAAITSSTAYSVPTGAKRLLFRVSGGGGGGGAGRRGASLSVRCGGGGGGGGAYSEWDVSVADLAVSTLYVTVGKGGDAGIAASIDDTNGGAGGAGNPSYIRTDTAAASVTNTLIYSAGGSAGGAGTASTGSGGATSTGRWFGGTGGSASVTGGAGNSGGVTTSTGPGGGAGGGITSGDTANAGGNGGGAPGRMTTAPAGGAVGSSGASGVTPLTLGYGSSGAGGGGSATTPGAGGAGAPGAGGGGGGASLNGVASGAGGAGGVGFVEITAYF